MSLGSKAGWFGVSGLSLILIIASIPGFSKDIARVTLIRLLSQAASAQWIDNLDNPLLCSRPSLNLIGPQAALRSAVSEFPPVEQNMRLLASAYCSFGEKQAALAAYHMMGSIDLASAVQQYAILIQEGDPSAAIQSLTAADLTDDEWTLAADWVVTRAPQVDPKPLFRTLIAKNINKKPFWTGWLTIGSRIQQSEGWAAALAWYKEGLNHSGIFTGSIALRAGRILQTAAEPRDNRAALAYYDQAITTGGFLSAIDESNAYMYRGEVYRSWPKEYSSTQALVEFDRALEINPKSSWAWISKGHVYLYDLKKPAEAVPCYQHALELDDRSPHANYYLGEVARIQGDLEQARLYFQQAQSLNPDWQAPQDRLNSLAGSQ